MNEYLGKTVPFGAPTFTDVFQPHELHLYQDSPLSPAGQKQAKSLRRTSSSFLADCDLVVVSPLTRALETLDIGLKEHLVDEKADAKTKTPVIALPEAAERLYLISDVGKPTSDLQKQFGYVDFEEGFGEHIDQDAWWYQPSTKAYQEWRPVGKGQKYACPGEPDEYFDRRMIRLFKWLSQRPEQKITVVCHWGVIDWMLDMDFDNCAWKEVDLQDVAKSNKLLQQV